MDLGFSYQSRIIILINESNQHFGPRETHLRYNMIGELNQLTDMQHTEIIFDKNFDEMQSLFEEVKRPLISFE